MGPDITSAMQVMNLLVFIDCSVHVSGIPFLFLVFIYLFQEPTDIPSRKKLMRSRTKIMHKHKLIFGKQQQFQQQKKWIANK